MHIYIIIANTVSVHIGAMPVVTLPHMATCWHAQQQATPCHFTLPTPPQIARDPSRANKLYSNRAIPAALRLLTVPGASDVVRLKGLALLQRLTMPEVSLVKEHHRHLQATIIKSIMSYTGEAIHDAEGEPVVAAIAAQVCASNAVLSERATLLFCTLACSDEYRCGF